MKFKKLLSECATSKTDSTMPIVALLAGLAVGAVVGILFAPESGAGTRGKISDKAGDLADSVKDKVHSVKEKMTTKAEEITEVKDQVVDDVRKKTKDVADHLKGAKDQSEGTSGAVQNS